MHVLVSVESRVTVFAGRDFYEGQIVIRFEEHRDHGPVVIDLPQDRALELASKIESTYQGIVGPADDDPCLPGRTAEVLGHPGEPTGRCAFTAHDTGDRCKKQGTLVHGGIAYFCEKHHNRGGSCPTSGG